MLQTISFLRTQHRPSITKQKRKHVCDASLQRGNPEAYSEFFSFILRLRAVKTHFGISSEQKTFTISDKTRIQRGNPNGYFRNLYSFSLACETYI